MYSRSVVSQNSQPYNPRWNAYESTSDKERRNYYIYSPSTPTESDLLAGVRRLEEGGQGEDGRQSARNDDVEAVIERQSSYVQRERDVDVQFRTAFVLHRVAHRYHSYSRTLSPATLYILCFPRIV